MTEQEYHLGRRVAEDRRDLRFLMRTAITIPPPIAPSVSYRRGPQLNQGATSSCVGHGWRAWLSGEPIRQVKHGPDALTIYHAAQQVDEWPGAEPDYEGTSVRAGAKVLQQLGFIQSYLWAFTEDTTRAWVLSGLGGVVIGVNWYEAMFSPDPTSGFLTVDGAWAGGHCVWLRGFSDKRQAYRVQNSWGDGWGQQGQAWLRAADLQRLLHEAGEACCGIEQQVSP
jgi:hypothetical protein